MDYSQLIGRYSLSKTLRFKLIPQGGTLENINNVGFIERDKKRAEDYVEVKQVIDGVHKSFIERVLGSIELDWQELADTLQAYRSQPNEQTRKTLESKQEKYRKKIADSFSKDDEYTSLFNKEIISTLIPIYIKANPEFADKKEIVASFEKFTTYFTGFHENRKNIYSSGDEGTSIAHRVVHENFNTFYDNCVSYQEAKKKYPEALAKATEELKEVLNDKNVNLEEIFSVNCFNKCLSQTGIDYYNLVLGGKRESAKARKIQGINECLNLMYQAKGKSGSRIKMSQLYKQILFDRESASFAYMPIEDDKQLVEKLEALTEKFENEIALPNGPVPNLLSAFNKADYEKVYVNKTKIPKLSKIVFGSPLHIDGLIKEAVLQKLGPFEKMTVTERKKYLAKKEFTLNELVSVFNISGQEVEIPGQLEAKLRKIFSKANESISGCNSLINLQGRVSGDSKKIDAIKQCLDDQLEITHYISMFDVGNALDLDSDFYADFELFASYETSVQETYNKVRGYLTSKAYRSEKYKLNFDSPTFAGGWDENKEGDNLTSIYLHDGRYYLGIMPKGVKIKFAENKNGDCQKMVYKQFPDIKRMFPKCTILRNDVKEHFRNSDEDYYIEADKFVHPLKVTKELFELNNHTYGDLKKFQKGYLQNEEIGSQKEREGEYARAVAMWNRFLMDFLASYKSTCIYDFSGIESNFESYKDVASLYDEVDKICYQISFKGLNWQDLLKSTEDQNLYLFEIYCKDFSKYSTGTPNLHTMYWNAIFDQENLRDVVVKLNGGAELFYRPKSIENPFVHKKGSVLLNKNIKSGERIPDSLYQELFEFVNQRLGGEALSGEAKALYESGALVTSVSKHDIKKDARYCVDQFGFHCPITLNFKSSSNDNINQEVLRQLYANETDTKFIGIDRGEKNLLYVSVVNQEGKILEQKSLNVINGVNYQKKLDQVENERQDARRNWKNIEAIKDLKKGYLSAAVYEITSLMVKHNAVLVLENLNSGFKRGRIKIEKQVYQNFERMLIEKMQYLVDKKLSLSCSGGLLKGYQLSSEFKSFKKLGVQSGCILYVPAWKTSKIDPSTGFANMFNLKYSNAEKVKEFFSNMKGIRFDSEKDEFEFSFDYNDFHNRLKNCRTVWTVCSSDDPRWVWSKEPKTNRFELQDRRITSSLKELFEKCDIVYEQGESFISEMLSVEDKSFWKSLHYYFSVLLQMRYQDGETGEDYILSPVRNARGDFYRTTLKSSEAPQDSDANGAYCIALKGIQLATTQIEYKSGKYKINAKVDQNAWLSWLGEHLLAE